MTVSSLLSETLRRLHCCTGVSTVERLNQTSYETGTFSEYFTTQVRSSSLKNRNSPFRNPQCGWKNGLKTYPVFYPNEIEEPVQQKMLAGALLQQLQILITPSVKGLLSGLQTSAASISNRIFSGEIVKYIINMNSLSTCCKMLMYRSGFELSKITRTTGDRFDRGQGVSSDFPIVP